MTEPIDKRAAIPKTRVVNLRRERYDVYIGRAGRGQDGYFGNPYRLVSGKGSADSRAQVMDDYRRYFADRIERDADFRERVQGLAGKTLGCFCKPGACHGDVIAQYLDSLSLQQR